MKSMKQIKKWIKRQEWYALWYRNWEKHWANSGYVNYWNFVKEYRTCFISFSFPWKSSDEGYEFWRNKDWEYKRWLLK